MTAMRSFAADADAAGDTDDSMEHKEHKEHKDHGECEGQKEQKGNRSPPCAAAIQDIEDLCRRTARTHGPCAAAAPAASSRVVAGDDGALWATPKDLADVFAILTAHPTLPARLVFGNTSTGVVKYYVPHPTDDPSLYVDMRRLPGFDTIAAAPDGTAVTLGAGVSLSRTIETFESLQKTWQRQRRRRRQQQQQQQQAGAGAGAGAGVGAGAGAGAVAGAAGAAAGPNPVLAALVRHLNLVAHWQVRDQASWAGNIMTAKQLTVKPDKSGFWTFRTLSP